MHVKTLKNIAAVLAVSALAIPAGVAAKGPSGDHGNSGDQHGQNHKSHHVSQRCKHQPSVGFTLGGTLATTSTGADNIIVNVTHANKHSKPFVSHGTYTVSGQASKVRFNGPNPFTTANADLSKYRVQVIGKAPKLKKGCPAGSSPDPTIKKVIVNAPDSGTGDDDNGNESGGNISGGNVSGGNVSGGNLG